MSVDTRVLIAGKVSVEAVVEALKTELGVVPTDNTRRETSYHIEDDIIYLSKTGEEKRVVGFISFEYKGERRNLFYYHTNIVFVSKENLELAIKLNNLNLAGEVTNLRLGYDDNAVEILTALAKRFNGYIDENDCDAHGYHKVE